ncbi:TaqI-like C-terminal specificity domain-containing protein [Butyrivibrio sp. YAB3001]|uniref:TaqI-like C-terminal specificity domain-containing protein n=1 Tax=Butyrivibrio sp. YAB3001 TaxID=1520812 RepID=UPI00158827AC|nr:TaqI-like C-terminal specificity domain-containing protein [Butyrivibrio sp. YAB3001]
MEKKEYLSIKETSEILGISTATVKNWVRLKKLHGHYDGASVLLKQKDILTLSNSLDSSSLLKQRRNKSRLNTNFIPKSYISNSSVNYKTIITLLNNEELTSYKSEQILYYYAESLMSSVNLNKTVQRSLLADLPAYNKETAGLLDKYHLTYIEGEDTLGMLYLSLRQLKDKKSTGSYYTPFFVVDTLINEVLSGIPKEEYTCKSFLDPSCGTGNFLLRLPSNIPLKNIHGYDIDKTAVTLSRINIAIKYKITNATTVKMLKSNVKANNFLLSDDIQAKERFDFVIGNPPWGYSFTTNEINQLQSTFLSAGKSGKPESFCLFLEKALSHKNIAFLLPETILGSKHYTAIRNHVMKNSCIKGISYLNEVFDNVQCPSIILHIGSYKDDSMIKTVFYSLSKKLSNPLSIKRCFYIPQSRITHESFNILADNEEFEIIKKMDLAPHFSLKGNCEFALGIVTGSNKTLLHSEQIAGSEPILTGKHIDKFCIKRPEKYIVYSADSFQQTAPEKIYRTKNKLFYRFIAAEPVVALDQKGLISLNSANIMIPNKDGYSAAYVMAILNSSAAGFYYTRTCKNMKVLRNSLEKMPIPLCDHDTMETISELAIRVQNLNENNDNNSSQKLIKTLDNMVSNLYNLNSQEKVIIMKK